METNFLAEQFEEHRRHLRSVGYRMLGSLSEADDAVQETWLRLSRSDATEIENLGGWLTTVTARVCLNKLRSRRTRPEEPFDAHVPDPIVSQPPRFSISAASERLSRSQVSCTASSASLSDPSIR